MSTMIVKVRAVEAVWEGIVVTPVKERFSDVLAGRCILKSVSADYLDRKDAQDNKN
jgi:hypothetical protein